jgi:hypothetical protein
VDYLKLEQDRQLREDGLGEGLRWYCCGCYERKRGSGVLCRTRLVELGDEA